MQTYVHNNELCLFGAAVEKAYKDFFKIPL